jgi:mono/diheme cytochrome c family protein
MKKLTMIAALTLLAGLVTFAWGADATAGKAVYTMKCQTCHAADGSGNPGIAKAMNVTLKPMSGEEVQKMSDADIKKVITMGSGKMKAVNGLTPAQQDDVIAYIHSMKK